MRGCLVIIASDGTRTDIPITEPPSLAELQLAVGGYLESVPEFMTTVTPEGAVVPCVAFCNENGKYGQRRNDAGTRAWHEALIRAGHAEGLITSRDTFVDELYGPLVLVYGDRELLDVL